ncbi:MAG: hypothetical protein HDS84_02810 [Bacteroidales bacterium]|nr:hypothetical protein [Bacteroidales bacterium]
MPRLVDVSANVGTWCAMYGRYISNVWRATSEPCDDVLFTMFAQTWHATSLHLSGNASRHSPRQWAGLMWGHGRAMSGGLHR